MTINMISQLIYRVSPKKKRIQGTGSCVFFCFFLWGFSKSNTLRTRDEATSDRRVSCFPAGVVRYHQRPGAGSAETKRKGEEKEEKRREEKRREKKETKNKRSSRDTGRHALRRCVIDWWPHLRPTNAITDITEFYRVFFPFSYWKFRYRSTIVGPIFAHPVSPIYGSIHDSMSSFLGSISFLLINSIDRQVAAGRDLFDGRASINESLLIVESACEIWSRSKR